jgi:hypothetical protein
MSTEGAISDGNLDVTCNVDHLSTTIQWKRKQQYLVTLNPYGRLTTAAKLELQFDLRFLERPKAERVKQVRKWKTDGKVRGN